MNDAIKIHLNYLIDEAVRCGYVGSIDSIVELDEPEENCKLCDGSGKFIIYKHSKEDTQEVDCICKYYVKELV